MLALQCHLALNCSGPEFALAILLRATDRATALELNLDDTRRTRRAWPSPHHRRCGNRRRVHHRPAGEPSRTCPNPSVARLRSPQRAPRTRHRQRTPGRDRDETATGVSRVNTTVTGPPDGYLSPQSQRSPFSGTSSIGVVNVEGVDGTQPPTSNAPNTNTKTADLPIFVPPEPRKRSQRRRSVTRHGEIDQASPSCANRDRACERNGLLT